jgi:biopolymer transport protein ExbB/TolQ
MPWKLLFYLILLGLILAFVGLNLGNTTDISLGFVVFDDVPVFMSLFVAFFLGVAVAIPIVMQSSSRKTRARTEKRSERKQRREQEKAAKAAAKAEKAARKEQKNTDVARVEYRDERTSGESTPATSEKSQS